MDFVVMWFSQSPSSCRWAGSEHSLSAAREQLADTELDLYLEMINPDCLPLDEAKHKVVFSNTQKLYAKCWSSLPAFAHKEEGNNAVKLSFFLLSFYWIRYSGTVLALMVQRPHHLTTLKDYILTTIHSVLTPRASSLLKVCFSRHCTNR